MWHLNLTYVWWMWTTSYKLVQLSQSLTMFNFSVWDYIWTNVHLVFNIRLNMLAVTQEKCQSNQFLSCVDCDNNCEGVTVDIRESFKNSEELLSMKRRFRKSAISRERLGSQKIYSTFWKWELKTNSMMASISS